MNTAIHDMLVLTFKSEDDILDEMIAQCGAHGPVCFAYLESKYNSTSLPAGRRSRTSARSFASRAHAIGHRSVCWYTVPW
eukprot:834616-Prymnesium_polylepis.1